MFESNPIMAVERIANQYQDHPAYEQVKHDADIVLGIRFYLDKRRAERDSDLAKGELQATGIPNP